MKLEANIEIKAKALVDYVYVGKLPGFKIEAENLPYWHMGATITDAILQAGLTWETTVKPRLDKIKTYYNAKTTSGFIGVLEKEGILNLLEWSDLEKPTRVLGLAQFFKYLGIEIESDLRNWFEQPGNDAKLLTLRGIGPKTLDYLKKLSGISCCAVDRHLRRFVAEAGIVISSNGEVKMIVDRAAELMSVDKFSFDTSIWRYMSRRKTNSLC